MKAISEIRPIKQSAEVDLLKRKGVTGVDIGKKIVKGEKTEELSIRVYVEQKKDVPEKERIPKEIQGVKTDVIQRKFALHPLLVRVADIQLKADTGSYDPLKGGISIGPCRSIYLTAAEAECNGAPGAGWYIFVGTLGAFVKDNATSAEMMLSNFHVMCVNNGWSVGDTIAQPGRVDGGTCPTDVVGALQRASLGGQVDCAVASHSARGYSCSIVDIGDVSGTSAATVGMAVRKRGRTTGLTYGTIDTVDLSVNIDYCNGLGSVTLTNQIGIDVDPAQSTMFGDHGDSGSVVVENSRKVVGLYFAGSEDGTYGVANPIQSVLTALNVSMCVPIKKIEKEWGGDVEQYKPEKYKPEPYKGPEQYKPEPYKPEKYKPEPYKGPEQYKPEPYKPEQYKPEQYKPEQYKPEQYKPEQFKSDPMLPREPIMSGSPSTVEERLARIEAAISQMQHFISPEFRPDLSKGSLHNESDCG
jgi:hypothetical protein